MRKFDSEVLVIDFRFVEIFSKLMEIEKLFELWKVAFGITKRHQLNYNKTSKLTPRNIHLFLLATKLTALNDPSTSHTHSHGRLVVDNHGNLK